MLHPWRAFPWMPALLCLALLAGCPAGSQSPLPGDAEEYPQAPMAVRLSPEGAAQLVVCATSEGAGERSPWIASLTLLDLGVEPPALLWEAVLPAERREQAWRWDPGVPWIATLGQAPPGFEDAQPLSAPLEKDHLYQVSLTGWDPGEVLFALEPDGRVSYYDAAGVPTPAPLLPCWQGI